MRTVGTWMVAVLLASSASAAPALTCDRWQRLDSAQKLAAVQRMIDEALSGNRGRSYQVNREAIARCLRDRSGEIVTSFDDVCADTRSADLQAIPELFTTYVWSCAG